MPNERPNSGPRTNRRPSLAQTDDWLTPGRFALGLAVLVFAAYPQVLLGWETFVARDYGLFSYPVASFQRACFWRGELPFWNPYNYLGQPFLAQWNTLALYPPALIYLLLPLGWSLSFFCLLHLWFAGVGMYWLAQRWTANRLAAAVAGVLFAFNGLSLNLLMWPSHIATLSWMPWVIFAVQRAWQKGGGWLMWAAGAGALQMLAGGPETILFTWLLLLGLWLLELRAAWRSRCSGAGGRDSLRAYLWRFPLVVLLVGGLAAAQLAPFLDFAAHSQRGLGFAGSRWSMPLSGWANFLVPAAWVHAWRENLFFQPGQYWTTSYYLGAGAVLLSLWSLGRWREQEVGWLWAVVVVAFICSTGDQLAPGRWLRQALPQLSLMNYPVKFVLLIVFALPLLAAVAVARFRRAGAAEASAWQRQLLWLTALLCLLIGGIVLYAWRSAEGGYYVPAWPSGLTRAAFLAGVIGILALLQRARSSQAQQVFCCLLLLGLWLDLRTHEPEPNPTVSPQVYAPGLVRSEQALKPEPALAGPRLMLSAAALDRFELTHVPDIKDAFLARRLGYHCNCNLLDAAPTINGFFSLQLRESYVLTSLFYMFTNRDLSPLADFLGVGYVTAPGELTDWQARSRFLPLATAGQKPEFLDVTNTVQRLLRTDFEPRQMVLLPEEARPQVAVGHTTQARVLSQRFGLQEAELEVEAAEPSMVVIAQSYFHPWRSYVDGRPVPLWRANLGCQALQVPGGRHRVRLIYQDRAFTLGAAISGLTAAGCLIGALQLWRRRGAGLVGASPRRAAEPENEADR